MVEIGCAPGRWLAYCNEQYGLDVAGYESSPAGAAKTRENLAFQGVRAELIEADVMSDRRRSASFDLVMSMGLIEHFDDPGAVVKQHARLAKPGGLIILEVPNLRGLTLALLRRTESPLLAFHNLDVMNDKVLRALARAAGLEVVEIRYIGGFEPQFVDASGEGRLFRTLFRLAATTRRRLRVLDNVNGSLFSGYICAILRKPIKPDA